MPCPAIVSPRSPVSILDWQRLVLKSDALTDAEKACAIALSHFINSRSGLAWPSMATLGAAAGLSEQTARRAVHKLESLGLVKILERAGRVSRFMLAKGTEVCAEVETPIQTDSPPLTPEIPERANERTNPPPPPSGALDREETPHHPAPLTPAARLERSTARQPTYRRTRRSVEAAPFIRAACHRPAPAEYLTAPPPRTMPEGALAGLRGALGLRSW